MGETQPKLIENVCLLRVLQQFQIEMSSSEWH